MTIALPALGVPRKHKIDLSWPILVLFAALLCVLIILPMSWLIYYSLVDRSGAFTLDNFKTLVTDPVFVDPLKTTLILATSSSIICCALPPPWAGWSHAPTCRCADRAALVTASFVTPPFLGAMRGSCWRRPTAVSSTRSTAR
jgi:ABC-type spermidine/putrescine transport system, permease component I